MLNFIKNGKGEILNLMFQSPDKKFYLSEISKILGKEPSAYQRYLENFIKEGIFRDERIGNMRFFWLNKEYSLYPEIKNIISKTIGIEAKLKEIVNSYDEIETSFIFGSYATDKFSSSSDIDLFIIGKPNQNKFVTEINTLEGVLNKEVNYHIYDKQEVLKKIVEGNDFISNILKRKILLLKGDINDYRTVK